MSNHKVVLAPLLAAILATGLLALNPSMVGNAQAQMYSNEYGYDNNYYQDDNRYSYDKKDPKSSHTDIQKIKCVNSNINVNGIDITQIPEDGTATAAANEAGLEGANAQNGNNGLADRINFERNLVNICVNVNVNEQIKTSSPEGTCEECFRNFLSDTQIDNIFPIQVNRITIDTLEDLCNRLEGLTDEQDKIRAYALVENALENAGIIDPQKQAVLDCLVELGLIIPESAPPPPPE